MPLTGAVPEGRTMTHTRLPYRDSNVAKCVVCGQIMAKWDSTDVPVFKLIHRPEDA